MQAMPKPATIIGGERDHEDPLQINHHGHAATGGKAPGIPSPIAGNTLQRPRLVLTRRPEGGTQGSEPRPEGYPRPHACSIQLTMFVVAAKNMMTMSGMKLAPEG